MINAKLQNIIDTKSAIGNAIVNKGGTITSETPFFNYAAQIDGISTGTPQTIFAASDGSKWALSNAVNLVNDAGNVTSDFNYWQPANNSTSDPILNIGTVGANISGNIRIVQVNQVNIAQYVNIVINDTTGAKYVGYNGYDFSTNPTPTGNTTFNRWLLNNSASGTIVFANTTIVSGGTFNGPNSTVNTSNLTIIANTAAFGNSVYSVFANNGRLFAGGEDNAVRSIVSYHESNLVQINTANAYGGFGLKNITFNNGVVFSGGGNFSYNPIRKHHESNLAFIAESSSVGIIIEGLVVKNNFVYLVSSGSNAKVQKFHEGNLVRVANGPYYGNTELYAIAVNNGFVYAGAGPNFPIKKYHEGNLVESTSSPIFGQFGRVFSLQISNGFVYAAGSYVGNADATNGQGRIRKYHEGNLAYTGTQSVNFGGNTNTFFIDGEFIYAGGEQTSGVNRSVSKLHKDNLVTLVNVPNFASQSNNISSIYVNGSFVYAGTRDVFFDVTTKISKEGVTPDNQTFYTATKIKE
jgi:hypothetical protein